MPDFFSEGNQPRVNDTRWRALEKILGATLAGGGGGSGLTFSTGSGSPEGVVVGSPGDTYWDTLNDFYYVKVTGTATNTGWEVH